MSATETWNRARELAATPGSSILTAWLADRQAARGVAAPRNDMVSSSDPRVLEFFGAGRAASGVSVTPDSAMHVSAVFACVQRIAGSIASMPIHQYEWTPTGGRARVENTPLWWLLNEQPTPRYTAASMWEGRVGHMLLRGDGFAFIGRSRSGEAKELIPLPWDAVEVERTKKSASDSQGGSDRLNYFINDVRRYGADQDDMLHFPGFGFDGCRSMSVIQWAARNAAGNAIAMDEYSGRFFAGGAHPSIVLRADGKMSPDQIMTLQTAFAAKYSGVDNAYKLPLVLTEGLKADTLSLSADDAQLLDARKFQVIDIARAFGVPPHLIGETSAATSWGAGLEEMSRGFVTYTLQQHLRRIEQELNRKLFRTARFFLEFNREALLEGNSKAQADYFRAALGGPGTGPGWMSVDEVRRVKNLPPVGDTAAKPYHPADEQANTDTGATT